MNRTAQHLILVLLAGAVLRVTVLSTSYLNYVKPGFHPFLVAAGAVVLALGVIGLIQEWREPPVGAIGPTPSRQHDQPHRHQYEDGSSIAHPDQTAEHGSADGHSHDHSRGPRVAWLLCLPVFAIFLIAPPPLGSFAARAEEAPARTPAVAEDYAALSADQVTPMTIGEFIGRAWDDPGRSLTGKQVKLTGFVVRSAKKKDRWYVTRMQMSCCAADAIALKVAVLGTPPPPDDTWVEVIGTWAPPKSDKIPNGTVAPELWAANVTEIPRPIEPYE